MLTFDVLHAGEQRGWNNGFVDALISLAAAGSHQWQLWLAAPQHRA